MKDAVKMTMTIMTSTVRIILPCHRHMLVTPNRQLCLISYVADDDLAQIRRNPILLLWVPAERYRKRQGVVRPTAS